MSPFGALRATLVGMAAIAVFIGLGAGSASAEQRSRNYSRCAISSEPTGIADDFTERELLACNLELKRGNPKDAADLYRWRGSHRSNLHDYAGAVADYTEALKTAPSTEMAELYVNRAKVFGLWGKQGEAIADFTSAIEHAPDKSWPYDSRSGFYEKIGNLQAAVADLDKAITVEPNPNPYSYFFRRATMLFSLGYFDRAIAGFDAAIKLKPTYAESYAGRGQAREATGDFAAALADYRAALEAGPGWADDGKPAQNLARIRIAALESLPAPNTTPPAIVATVGPETVIPAPSGRRVALVIGNSAYTSVAHLPNPRRDADAVGAALRAIGFAEVTVVDDADRAAMVAALQKFSVVADTADWALIYYAGHGIEVGGTNYLIPTDAKLVRDRDVPLETIPLDQALASLEGGKALKLVVLDSCRENPFAARMQKTVASRSIGRGFDRIEPQSGTLVVYAAKDGEVALDGDGVSSPFAQSFLSRLATPGVELGRLFRMIRDDVMKATDGAQEPFVYGSLPGSADFFFVAAK